MNTRSVAGHTCRLKADVNAKELVYPMQSAPGFHSHTMITFIHLKKELMIKELINQHSGDIAGMLGTKYGLDSKQATSAASSITDAVGGFFTDQLSSGKLDLSQVTDLFNKNTPNESNALFSQLSSMVSGALSSNPNLTKDLVSKISSGGLNDIIGLLQGGKLGNIDMGTITKIAGSLTGKGGIGDMLGGLSGLFGKK